MRTLHNLSIYLVRTKDSNTKRERLEFSPSVGIAAPKPVFGVEVFQGREYAVNAEGLFERTYGEERASYAIDTLGRRAYMVKSDGSLHFWGFQKESPELEKVA